jgi:thioredoxin 1
MINKKSLLEALKNKQDTIIYFYADWCQACKEIRPKIYEIADKTNMNVYFINEDEELENKFNVEFYPTIVFIKENTTKKYTGTNKITMLHENLI